VIQALSAEKGKFFLLFSSHIPFSLLPFDTIFTGDCCNLPLRSRENPAPRVYTIANPWMTNVMLPDHHVRLRDWY
jgi:hypothetical protein